MKALTKGDNPIELVKWTQDAVNKFNTLEKEIETLQKQLTALQAQVDALEGG